MNVYSYIILYATAYYLMKVMAVAYYVMRLWQPIY